jgi:uncharacterized membrane protein YphA (DoxX/SURF4 family)
MMNATTLGVLALLAGVLLLIGVSVRLARAPGETLGAWSKFFLVCLRLVIGWHFLIEGLDKLHSPSWSSEVYLREAGGPLAPRFRELAGDRLIDMLTVGDDNTFPSELDAEWQAYLDAFADFYELADEQRGRAKSVVDQAKADTVIWLTSTRLSVQKPAPYPPPLTVALTIPERLEVYQGLQARVSEIEAELPRFGEEKFTEYRRAKADLSKWRADLMRDLDGRTAQMKEALRDQVLFEILRDSVPKQYGEAVTPKKIDKEKDDPAKKKQEWLNTVRSVYGQIRLAETSNDKAVLSPQAERIFVHAFDRKQNEKNQDDPLPYMPRRPVSTWSMLDWSDVVVKYGLIAVGGCLLLGLLTRTACVAGALFLLMFFLAMPPLPYLPESPRAEGHYLYINKNIIEMFALLALATLRSGRWAGLDGLLQFLRPARWRAAPVSGTVN